MRLVAALIAVFALVPVAASLSQTRASASASAGWSWPDSAKNLKVLPKDTNGPKLRAVMTGYTRALGVRCTHCHVGKEGEPLTTYDFASDKNPKKDVARGMVTMVGHVNDELAKLLPAVENRVTVGCITCHRGVPRPRALADELALVYDAAGADSALARYRSLRAAFEQSGAYDFREPSLNQLAFHALEKQDGRGALAVLRENETRFPESGRIHELLGEAYLAAGDTTNAVAEFERSVKMTPDNPGPAQRLHELGRR